MFSLLGTIIRYICVEYVSASYPCPDLELIKSQSQTKA